MARTGQPATRHVAAVQRAIAILEALAAAKSELGTNEIARRTGINESSISRILATLASGGLVEHLPSTGRYRLGVGIMRLATAAGERLDIRTLARPHLEELAQRTRETVTLSVPGTREAMTLDFVQSPLSVRSVAEVGRASAAHATAVGKIFLAHGGSLPGGQLKRFTERTIVDRDALAVEVSRIGWPSRSAASPSAAGHKPLVSARTISMPSPRPCSIRRAGWPRSWASRARRSGSVPGRCAALRSGWPNVPR